MNPDRDDSQGRIERTLLPGREIVPGVPAEAVEHFGRITDAREAPQQDAKTVFLIKHIHGTSFDNRRMFSPQAFDEFLQHQDAVYGTLMLLEKKSGQENRFKVALEGISTQSTFPSGYLNSIVTLQTFRDAGAFNGLENMRRDMAAGTERGEWARHHLHGGIRYFAHQYVAGRTELLLPGRPPPTIDLPQLLKKEVQQLVMHTFTRGSFDDEEVNAFVTHANERRTSDHMQRHSFLLQTMNNGTEMGGLGVVIYGGEHFSDGTTPLPLEDVFNGWRVFVFEPAKFQECKTHPDPSDRIGLDIDDITYETVRTAIQKALSTAGPSWGKDVLK